MARIGLVVVALLAGASLSYGQVPDHLKCYKVKDPSAKAEYTADLGGLAPEPGCVIKTPAKMLCVESTKANVAPAPPGAPAGQTAGRFVCYAVKCPKGELPAVAIVDQFGSRDLQPGKAKLLCAPVAAPSTTTSTTATTTSSTASTSSTTTSTTLCTPICPPCRTVPVSDTCGGTCSPNCGGANHCCEPPQGCTTQACF
jgi:hypothetical protein